jgi:hypothetical protein
MGLRPTHGDENGFAPVTEEGTFFLSSKFSYLLPKVSKGGQLNRRSLHCAALRSR